MSEMLGNQYFMARNYEDAQKYLLPVYKNDPSNKLVKRKLVICSFMTGNVSRAFDLFFELINEDIEFIIKADPIFDDCPCQEIITELNLEKEVDIKESDQFILRGLIWLFCNPEQSLALFKKAGELEPNNSKITKTINVINRYIETEKESV
ncbi:MAG: hypothetical protein GXO87_14610 [Chlorobi bacterium]|nr:hypothetical protein [Chlorobiota bacterium]